MKNNDIKERLRGLADELNGRPCIATRIAEDLPTRRPSPQVERPTQHRVGSRGRWMVGVGTAAAAAALVFMIVASSTSVSFAQVRSALADIRTVIVTKTFVEHPEMRQRLLASVDHDTYRSEHANGAVFILSRNGKTLLLNEKNKTGQVTPGAGFGRDGEMPTPIDYLKSLRAIEETAVRSLGEKVFDGRTLIGFDLPPLHRAKRTIWVDPDTKLPVREEVARIGDISGADEGYAAYRMPASVSTYEFNVEIPADAFSMTPSGYTIVDFREFEAPWQDRKPLPEGINPTELVISPGEGLGPITFGMSLEQVVSLLGKPDQELVLGELTEAEQKALDEVHSRADSENMDVYERNREMRRALNRQPQRVIKRSGVRLHYYSLGLDIGIDDTRGTTAIECYAKAAAFSDFGGRFENGISMASSIEDVKRQFGKPSREYSGGGYSSMFFEESRVGFSFNESGVASKIDLFAPAEK